MDDESFYEFEAEVFTLLEGKLSQLHDQNKMDKEIESIAKTINPAASPEEIKKIVEDSRSFPPVEKYLDSDEIEDIMINNVSNIFVYKSSTGPQPVEEKIPDRTTLSRFVKKLRMYATSVTANKHIYDVHLPNGSRANIVDSPVGQNITIRNFKKKAFSIIDLINNGELGYNLAGRLWLYAEGLRVRPANILIGGTPGAGKTTLLNSMFSFFRPEERVAVVEETYELNTETQDNCVRLETSPEVNMKDLLQNVLRMRPDMIIIGEVRGEEARDMMTAMNIGKIGMSTIHASTTREMVTRLEHNPMNVDSTIIPLIDAMLVVSTLNENGRYIRKITQVSEISGIETKVLLSDLYTYDYRTKKGTDILPSVTYRDNLAKLTGHTPKEIIDEELRRSKVLERLNKMGIRDLRSINQFCKEYYDSPEKALKKIDLAQLGAIE